MDTESLRNCLFQKCADNTVEECVKVRDDSVLKLGVECSFCLLTNFKCPFSDCTCQNSIPNQDIVAHIVKEHGVPIVNGNETQMDVDFFSSVNSRTWVPVVFKAFQRDFVIVITEGTPQNGLTHIAAFVFEPPNLTTDYFNIGFALMRDDTHADFIVSQKINPGTSGMLSALMEGTVVYIPSNLLKAHGKPTETGVVSCRRCTLKFKILTRKMTVEEELT